MYWSGEKGVYTIERGEASGVSNVFLRLARKT
jgi:hypothetical protein